MTRKLFSALAPFALLCVSPAWTQQPAAPAPPTQPDVTPKPPRVRTRDARNVQYRVIGPEGLGVRTDLRIAPPGMWWKNPDIVQKLSLSADQQKRMDDIFQQSRLQLIDFKANVEKQEVMLEPMLSANPPDTNKVLGQIDKVASARAELEKANAKMLLGIRGVLSADQWTKLQAEQRENRRMMFRFNPGPMGPGPRDNLKFGPGGPLSFFTPPLPPGSGPEIGGEIGGFGLEGPDTEIHIALPDDDLDL